MCGRYNLTSPPELIAALFDLAEAPVFSRRYNIAPTQGVPVVRERGEGGEGKGRTAELLRWGLVPSWADDLSIGGRMINARSEEIESKPAYRGAFKRRRCLVPATGFYEWQVVGGAGVKGKKQPYHIRMKGGEPFAMAGVWEFWKPKGAGDEEEGVVSFSILTGPPNELVAPIHNRMPVILGRESYGLWLDPAVMDVGKLKALLTPFDAGAMEAVRVSTRVNRPENDDSSCVQPIDS